MNIDINGQDVFKLPEISNNFECKFSICVQYFRKQIKFVHISVLSQDKNFKNFDLSFGPTFNEPLWRDIDFGYIIDKKNNKLIKPSIISTSYCKVHKCGVLLITPPSGAKGFYIIEMGGSFEFRWVEDNHI